MDGLELLCDEGLRVVQAPEPIASGVLSPHQVISVTLEPGEDVAWIWTFAPDGGSYVSGYRIIKPECMR